MNLRKWTPRLVVVGLAAGALLVASVYPAFAATAPSLGSAQSFAVLGGTTVTNTGPTTITGDLGVSPGAAITGLGSITVSGAVHAADALALQAQNDVTTAYNALASAPCTQSFTGTAVEIGGQTLTPGVYCYSSSAQLTGTLTLNGNGVYIFKMASTLTTATGSRVVLMGGATSCNVFWQVGSSADLFTNSTFVGSVLALTSINLQTGTSVAGRALARNGAVTMDRNTFTGVTCATGASASPSASTSASPSASTSASPSASPAATRRPTATPSVLLPATDTVPAPPQGGGSSWFLVLGILAVGSLALVLGVRRRAGRTQ
jgi:hypothetical protein